MSIRPSRRQSWSVIHSQLRPVAALLCLLFANCGFVDWLGGKRVKAEFCAQHPDNEECRQEYPDADTRCQSNSACMAPTPVCDLAGSMMCVQCIAPDQTAACTGTTPICGADHACRPCSEHRDCSMSNACLPDGACAPSEQVAYVDPVNGNGSTCSLALPCKQVTEALKKKLQFVKLTGTISEFVQITDQTVTLLADPGTQLTRATAGVILAIDGASVVQIIDLAIANGLGSTGIGISLPPGNSASLSLLRVTVEKNAGGGISATGGSLTISRSTIAGNTQNGISVSGSEFDITNSVIVGNGGASTPFGGVRFDQTNNGMRRFDFNTITGNVAIDGSAVGVLCTLVTTPVTFRNNIVYANQIGGTRTQVGGANCNWAFSDIGPDAVSGTQNINADPLFVNPAQGDFHLQSMSPAKDKADPGGARSFDIDGDARPQGSGFDIGADEVK
jgi:hypothetical protein